MSALALLAGILTMWVLMAGVFVAVVVACDVFGARAEHHVVESDRRRGGGS